MEIYIFTKIYRVNFNKNYTNW